MWYDEVIGYGLAGLKTTLVLSAFSLAASVIVGFLLGTVAYLQPRLRWVIALYNQIWRGLPVLVTLFVVFFMLPFVGIVVGSNVAVIVGLSLWGSANVAEIVFGAFRSMPPSQSMAARALGFGKLGALVYVLLPQALKRILPAIVNILSNMIQATALATAVGAVDLLEAVKRATTRLTFDYGDSHSFAVFGSVMLIYFLICYPLSFASRVLERRTH